MAYGHGGTGGYTRLRAYAKSGSPRPPVEARPGEAALVTVVANAPQRFVRGHRFSGSFFFVNKIFSTFSHFLNLTI